MSKASHTKKTTAGNLRLVPGLGLVDLGRSGLSETLAGKVGVELGKFAERMHEGLLSASIGIGMEVLGECRPPRSMTTKASRYVSISS
jgi:hypothetical protein